MGRAFGAPLAKIPLAATRKGDPAVPQGPWTDIGDELRTAERAEWLVADVSLARALFSGVPVARLLARTRLASDEADLSSAPLGAEPYSRWDTLMKGLLGKSAATFERTKRQIARHARAASDEGPLPASSGVVALLAYACAASTDPDASMAEAFARPEEDGKLDPQVAAAVAEYEPRLLLRLSDPRAALFEACVRLAALGSAGPWPIERLADAARQLASSEAKLALVHRSDKALYPRDLAMEIPPQDRRMLWIERSELDALVTRDPRELAAIVARTPSDGVRDAHLDSLLADLARLLAHPGTLVLAAPMLEPAGQENVAGIPSSRAPSWLPSDWSSGDAGAAMADAFERGATTQPRIRAAVARGGDPALDAIGAEMLRVGAHPFASAAFAELLARSGRTRDIARLVTYFAVAPDPAPAARALSLCTSPELPGMLTAWLEAMLPHDGAQAPHGADPLTSSGARLLTCIASLAPYPHLYRAVRPLLSRVSAAPPPA
jgi:hypothetical protein